MANIFHVERAANKITLGTTGTTINVPPLTASLSLGLDASKNLESVDLSVIYQPLDAVLTDLAVLDVVADNEFIVGMGAGVYAHESGDTVRTSLGLAIGSNVQAHGDVLDDLNTLGVNSADNEFLVGTGAGTLAWESGATARTSIGLGTGNSPQFTGLGIGAAGSADTVIIQTSDTDNPTITLKTTHTAHQIDVYLNGAVSTADRIVFAGQTAAKHTDIMIDAQAGKDANLFLRQGGGTNYSYIAHQGNTNHLLIENNVLDRDIIFAIDDGGVPKNIRWDADVDKLKHSAGLFDFDDDNITTTGTLGCGVITQSGTTLANTYQPLDVELTSLAALSYAATSFVKMTGANTFVLRTIGETADDLETTIDHDNLANGGAHDYAYISGNDGATGITAAELEELSDGSETTLHTHAAGADAEKVKVDVGATADYIGAANNNGVLRTTTGLSYADGGNYVTLGLSHLGIESLTDPDVDRCLFWDDSESAIKWLTVMQGVQINGTKLQFDVNSLTEDTIPATNDYLVTYDVSHATPGYEHKKVLISNFPNLYADGDNPTINDSESNAMLKAHAYLTQTAGFVNAYILTYALDNIIGYVGTTNDPAGAGTKVDQQSTQNNTSYRHVFFFVASGKYFEITSAAGTPTIIWTPFVSGGAAPIDQD